MMPIDLLIAEHRIIEKMVAVIGGELFSITEKKVLEPTFVPVVVDFFRTYADKCHHGKEEDILFRDLAKKQLSPNHQKIMNELIQEHVYARKTVNSLENANKSYIQGNLNAIEDVLKLLDELVNFYPIHIEREDDNFFIPSMKYFSQQEQNNMLQEFWTFDRNMIHKKYNEVINILLKDKEHFSR